LDKVRICLDKGTQEFTRCEYDGKDSRSGGWSYPAEMNIVGYAARTLGLEKVRTAYPTEAYQRRCRHRAHL
jgi:hypothetical protein